MKRYPFLFSDEKKYRFQRHILFWLSWWLFCTFLYSFAPVNELKAGYFKRLQLSSTDAFFYMFAHMFLAYTLMYFVIPRYLLKAKYWAAALSTIVCLLLTASLAALIGMYVLNPVWKALISNPTMKAEHLQSLRFHNALLGGLRGAITIGGFAAAIKLMKYLYRKEQNNLELQKQNVSSQLQLLKAQVHPHFLFNTLNNIYSFTQANSPKASRMVAGLSDLLRYMLYECDQQLVPLHKELKMLQDYILLEQMRYDQQLDISVTIPEVDQDLLIAPLLLLPFVENSFKHGTSQALENPWISLTISVSEKELKMKLVNGRSGKAEGSSQGIGVANVKKRLHLVYPDRHQLRISQSEDTFIVTLNLQLDKKPVKAQVQEILTYA